MPFDRSICLRDEALAPSGASICGAAVSTFAVCSRDRVERNWSQGCKGDGERWMSNRALLPHTSSGDHIVLVRNGGSWPAYQPFRLCGGLPLIYGPREAISIITLAEDDRLSRKQNQSSILTSKQPHAGYKLTNHGRFHGSWSDY